MLGVSDRLDELEATIPLGSSRHARRHRRRGRVHGVAGGELGDGAEPPRGRRPDRAQLPVPTTYRLKGSSTMDFEGKVLFATGGGSGIAAATAQRFAAGGGQGGGRRPRRRQGGGVRPWHRRRDRARRRRGGRGIRARRRGVDARALRAHRLRAQRRRPCRVRSDRGVDARRLEPDDVRARRRHVPRVQGGAADHARPGRRLDRQHRVNRRAHRQQQQLALRRGEGRHRLVLAAAGARGCPRRAGQHRRTRVACARG